jgi:hypothetical protein
MRTETYDACEEFETMQEKGITPSVAYRVNVWRFEDIDSPSDPSSEEDSVYCFSADKAREIAQGIYNDAKIVPEKGEYLEICIFKADVEEEDLNEDMSFEEFIENLYWNSCNDFDSLYKYPKYDNIEGAIYVTWSWEPYVGYARKFEGLNIGSPNQTEEDIMTHNEDYVFRKNNSIIVTGQEAINMSKSELYEVIKERLEEPRWKWKNTSYIEGEICTLLEQY